MNLSADPQEGALGLSYQLARMGTTGKERGGICQILKKWSQTFDYTDTECFKKF